MTHLLVSLRFQKLIESIVPRPGDMLRAQGYVAAIRARLEQRFEVRRVVQLGSHAKGTAIRDHSDVDLFVLMSREEARKWNPAERSNNLLNRVREDLQERYHSTSVRRDRQAVVLRFKQGDAPVDVVPGIFDSFNGSPRYRIPDGDGGWIATAPQAQQTALTLANARSGAKLLNLVRMLKWWAASRNTTIETRGLYFEFFLQGAGITIPMTYQFALAHIFNRLAESRCPPLFDPAAVSTTPLRPTSTDAQHAALLTALDAAAWRSADAINAEEAGDWREAIRQWAIVFNHEFPG